MADVTDVTRVAQWGDCWAVVLAVRKVFPPAESRVGWKAGASVDQRAGLTEFLKAD